MTTETQQIKIIFNADDFGISKEVNQAVLEGHKNGLLSSTSLMANGPAFEDAILNILPQCKDIGIGVHLNIIEGKSQGNFPTLCDKNSNYRNGFIKLLLKSANKQFLQEVEQDFRLQIETILKYAKVDHINSHVHVHAIPAIFEITCKLAKEYNIQYVRTQYEIPYFVPDIKKYFSLKYPVNLIKVALLNFFTLINRKTIEKYGLNTNKYFIGVNYTGYMDVNTIKYGINKIKDKKRLVEIAVHPTYDNLQTCNYTELLATLDEDLKERLAKENVGFVRYSDLTQERENITM